MKPVLDHRDAMNTERETERVRGLVFGSSSVFIASLWSNPSGMKPRALHPPSRTAALKPPQSRRSAPPWPADGSRQRLDCGVFSTALGTTPRPPERFISSTRGLRFSLSQRERAWVRENGCKFQSGLRVTESRRIATDGLELSVPS